MTDREHANCPQCGYSASPDRKKTERKHFDAHYLRCTRCLYQTETKPSFPEALRAWNKASARAVEQQVLAAQAGT